MKKKFGIIATILIMSSALLSACGPTDEKIMELETAVGLMMEAKESAEETYLDITDSSMEEKLKELDEKTKEYENIDHKKYNDTKNPQPFDVSLLSCKYALMHDVRNRVTIDDFRVFHPRPPFFYFIIKPFSPKIKKCTAHSRIRICLHS